PAAAKTSPALVSSRPATEAVRGTAARVPAWSVTAVGGPSRRPDPLRRPRHSRGIRTAAPSVQGPAMAIPVAPPQVRGARPNSLPPGLRPLFQVEALTGYEMLTWGHDERPVGCVIMGPIKAIGRLGFDSRGELTRGRPLT